MSNTRSLQKLRELSKDYNKKDKFWHELNNVELKTSIITPTIKEIEKKPETRKQNGIDKLMAETLGAAQWASAKQIFAEHDRDDYHDPTSKHCCCVDCLDLVAFKVRNEKKK